MKMTLEELKDRAEDYGKALKYVEDARVLVAEAFRLLKFASQQNMEGQDIRELETAAVLARLLRVKIGSKFMRWFKTRVTKSAEKYIVRKALYGKIKSQ